MSHIQLPQGLIYLKSPLSNDDCISILNEIDSSKTGWSNDLDRRTQHYGVRYDYKTKKIVNDAPPIIGSSVQRCINYFEPWFKHFSNNREIVNVIVNEYTSGQKISKHIDSKQFGDVVMTFSLGDSADMIMRRGNEIYTLTLNSGDIVILTGQSRYEWTHEIKSTTKIGFRRVSITFR